MGDFYGVCALLAALMFFVLIQKFDKKFGKVEKELDEIKKRMDAFLKAQERIASDHVQSKENVSAEAVEDTCIPPHAANEIPVPKKELLRKEEQLEAPQGMMAENNVTSEIPVVTPSVRKQKKVNYEKFIGENLFGKIGIFVFVIGVGFFVKYAIDKDWINETLRTVLGFLTGSALLVVAERLQKKYRTFSSLLAGGAFAVFYLTVAIAFHFYHLFPQTVAFIILIVITLFMSILSVLYDRRELAIISLV